MKIVDRYIRATVASHTLLVLMVFIVLFAFITFADEMNRVGQGDYDVAGALIFTLYTLPGLIYQLFPPAALIGCLLGLGALASRSELVAMRAAGVSIYRIVWSVIKVGLLLMAMTVVVGEVLAPRTESLAIAQRSLALHQQQGLRTRDGYWMKEGSSFVQIGSFSASNRIKDVVVYDFDQAQGLRYIIRAASGKHIAGAGWELRDVQQMEISKQGFTRTHLPRLMRPDLIQEELLDSLVEDPATLSIFALWNYIGYLDKNGLDASAWRQSFWNKLTAPFMTLIMVLLAVPFVFGALRNTGGGHRILIGVLVGLGFHIVTQLFSYAGLVFSLNPVLTAVTPAVLFLTVAMMMLRRVF